MKQSGKKWRFGSLNFGILFENENVCIEKQN